LVAAQAGRGTDGLGVATVAMWPPVPRREADLGGRGAANRVRPWLFGRSGAEAKIKYERGRPPAGGVKNGAAGGREMLRRSGLLLEMSGANERSSAVSDGHGSRPNGGVPELQDL
jgi:hypothetical protein